MRRSETAVDGGRSCSSAPMARDRSFVIHDNTPSATRSVIGRLLWDHLAVVEADADIVRNTAVYHSILAHHLQDALDDVAVYVRSGGGGRGCG